MAYRRQRCGIPAVVNFARTLIVDIQAVRNAVIVPWSNDQTKGQINRLKALKRADARAARGGYHDSVAAHRRVPHDLANGGFPWVASRT